MSSSCARLLNSSSESMSVIVSFRTTSKNSASTDHSRKKRPGCPKRGKPRPRHLPPLTRLTRPIFRGSYLSPWPPSVGGGYVRAGLHAPLPRAGFLVHLVVVAARFQ